MSEKCTVKDGRFVDACEDLKAATDYRGLENRKGICVWEYTNTKTRQPSRTFYGIKTKQHPKGLAFNMCPFCGERIDAPFNTKEAA